MIFFQEFLPESELSFFGNPSHIGDLIERAQVVFGSPVTIETPPHGQRLVLANHLHLVDSTMTGNTADASVHMGAMIEVDEIG